jgi:predicted ester cyclase
LQRAATGAAAIAALIGATRAAPAATATPAALLARYVALKNAHDASRCAEIYAEAYVEHSGRNPSGLIALVANWQAQFDQAPDLHLTLEDQVIAGDKVVARCTYAGTHTRPFLGLPPTGRRFSFGTIDIWRVADGRFVEHWDQVDFAGLVRQLKPA